MPHIKVAIYSLTRDRLDYSKHCFKALAEKAGYPYDHFVIDNGSEDGTQKWLKRQESKGALKTVVYNEVNQGIAPASNRILDVIGDDYDLIIKMDNDCEVVTEGLLRQIVLAYGSPPFEILLLSPRVGGLINQPVRQTTGEINGQTAGFVPHVGGIFAAFPSVYHKQFRWDPKRLFYAKGCDRQFSRWVGQIGGRCAYLENVLVNHYETTLGQKARYPGYFERKYEEEKTPYAN